MAVSIDTIRARQAEVNKPKQPKTEAPKPDPPAQPVQKYTKRPRQSGTRDARHHGRLPDGSCFQVAYDAASETWSGSLTVPSDSDPSVYTDQADGVFGLLEKLHYQRKRILYLKLVDAGKKKD